MGAALVAPVRALRAADHCQGKTGSDLALLIALLFLVTRTPGLVSAVWLGYAEGVGLAFGSLIGEISAAVVAEITLLFIGTIALTLAAGRRRSLGRDLDLACVSLVPFVSVELVAGVVFALADAEPRGPAADVTALLAYGWALAVLVLALRQARSRPIDPDRAVADAGGSR